MALALIPLLALLGRQVQPEIFQNAVLTLIALGITVGLVDIFARPLLNEMLYKSDYEQLNRRNPQYPWTASFPPNVTIERQFIGNLARHPENLELAQDRFIRITTDDGVFATTNYPRPMMRHST